TGVVDHTASVTGSGHLRLTGPLRPDRGRHRAGFTFDTPCAGPGRTSRHPGARAYRRTLGVLPRPWAGPGLAYAGGGGVYLRYRGGQLPPGGPGGRPERDAAAGTDRGPAPGATWDRGQSDRRPDR